MVHFSDIGLKVTWGGLKVKWEILEIGSNDLVVQLETKLEGTHT